VNPQLLPAQLRDDARAWTQTIIAFLAEKERRSGSRRTVEDYARMLWPFFERVGSPGQVTPAHVLAWAHGIGGSGREPASAIVGARIACLSSYYRFLIRMTIANSNPCDALDALDREPAGLRVADGHVIRGTDRSRADGTPSAQCTGDRRIHPLAASALGGIRRGRAPVVSRGDLREARRIGLQAVGVRAHAGCDRSRSRRGLAVRHRSRKPDC
jgi:hypothetical protein